MRRLLLSAVLAIAAAGCTSENSVQPIGSLSGNYTLETVNGQGLPYAFSTASGSYQLNSDVLTLYPDGTYADVGQYYSLTDGSSFSSTELGTYSAYNGSLTFYDQTDNLTYSGSVSGTVLTEISGSLTEVFQKQ